LRDRLLDNVVDVFNLTHKNLHMGGALIASMAALSAPLLSIAILLGAPIAPMAFSKKRFAAAMLRFGSRKSMALSCFPTAW
jgi:hypothetical protein